jgi:hypothetical protein
MEFFIDIFCAHLMFNNLAAKKKFFGKPKIFEGQKNMKWLLGKYFISASIIFH